MKALFYESHLTEPALIALLAGVLDDKQLSEAAAHLAGCPACAGLLARAAEQNPADTPAGLAGLTAQYVAGREQRRQSEYVRFCVRVAACAAAVIGLSVYSLFRVPDPQPITAPAQQAAVLPVPASRIPAPGDSDTIWQMTGDFLENLSQFITKQQEETDLDQTKE